MSDPQSSLDFAQTRSGDPETSYAAAKSVTGLNRKRRDVLEALTGTAGLTDEKLIMAYQAGVCCKLFPPQSDSGIRTRRKELVDLGMVIDSGQRAKTASGRDAIIWQAKK